MGNREAGAHDDYEDNDTVMQRNQVGKGVMRRLAAIPLVETPAVHVSTGPSMVTLGAATGVLVCTGYVLRRRCLKAKQSRRDSFGFLPDAERDSLNAAEMNV